MNNFILKAKIIIIIIAIINFFDLIALFKIVKFLDSIVINKSMNNSK
jgi:hypothetical protein